MSLFACSPADVTVERVRDLVGQDLPESLTLEYKERYSPSLVKSVGAMANSYGGLILVGVTDEPGPGRLAGVPEAAVVQIANACHEKLEPPWEPEIIPVPLADEAAGLYVLVIRVDPARAPRPILIEGAAPIRLHGRNATADRARLAQLFSEASIPLRSAGARLDQPDLPAAADGYTGRRLRDPDGAAHPGRGRGRYVASFVRAGGRGLLADALNNSPLQPALLQLVHRNGDRRASRHFAGPGSTERAMPVWPGEGQSRLSPVILLRPLLWPNCPTSSGAPSTSLTLTLDVIIRANAYIAVTSFRRAWRPAISAVGGRPVQHARCHAGLAGRSCGR